MKRIALLACTGLFAFGLAACGDKENSEPASEAAVARQTSDPAKAVEAFAAKLKENNVLEAVQFAVPPAKLDEIRADWKSKMAEETPTEEEKAEFAQNMAKFTAPNAEETLYAELEPLLVKFETEMAAQMPMMIGMGQGFAMQTIQANEELTEAQKQQATEVIGALAGWLQTAKFASGQVSSLEASGSQPRINFTDDQGNAVSYAQDGFVFGYQRGMPVGVHYRPEAPVSSAVIDDAGAIWGSTLLLGLLGASMTLAGMPTLRVRRLA